MARHIMAAIGLALTTIAACGSNAPAPAPVIAPTLTPYQAALAAICDENITITPAPGQQPWVPIAWRAGFCHDPFTSTFTAVQQAIARSADTVRLALAADPPLCAIAQSTPASRYCPWP